MSLLKFSEQLNGYPRLGQAGDDLVVREGVETIDVSPTGRYQISGHEYFMFNPRVTADLEILLGQGKVAGDRQGLVETSRNGKTYWVIE